MFFSTGNYPPSSYVHIIPASFSRSLFIVIMFVWQLLWNVLPARTDFPRLTLWNVTFVVKMEKVISDWPEISFSYASQLNTPKKINTAGSASAACNNTIRGKWREFGRLQIHTHTYTHNDDMYGMDGLLWTRLYALPVVFSKNGMKNKKRKVLLGSHREDWQRRSTTLQITKSPLKTQSQPFICACLLSARNSLW